jgi:hypothetical protein
MTTLHWKIYYPPTGELDGLIRERERIQSCADRAAEKYAAELRAIDERIAEIRTDAVKAQNESVSP